jgi:hypothetical protein
MSQADEFRQYAKEAMRDARQSKSENEKEALIDLAHTWAQAALRCGPALRPLTSTVSAAPKTRRSTRSRRTLRRCGRVITHLLFEPRRVDHAENA